MNPRATVTAQHGLGARSVRLVLIEDGAPPTPLPWASEGPETTIVVGAAEQPSHEMIRRVDRRMAEMKRTGQAIGEVVFVLADRGGEEPCLTRLSMLLTVIRHLQSVPQGEIALILPASAPADIRHEVFALAEVLVAELCAGAAVRIRFIASAPEPHESGFFASPRAALTAGARAPIPYAPLASTARAPSRTRCSTG